MSVNETVIQTLKSAGEPLKAGEIAEKAALDKKDVDKAIKALKADGVVTSPKRCYYTVD